MKTIQRNASDAEIFGRMMKVAQHGTFDGLVQEGGDTRPKCIAKCPDGKWFTRDDCEKTSTRKKMS